MHVNKHPVTNFPLLSELPQYPNVDPFNYETMKKMLLDKLDSFAAAPFTIQRISELLSDPRKQYSRIDKFMRAVEKTILVVSTVPPGRHRSESENGDSLDSALNGDFASEVNVDIEMDQDGSFAVTKDTSVAMHRKEQNHEVTTATQETITIKKTEKDEEAGTSEKSEEKVEATVTVESVSISVIEPVKEAEVTKPAADDSPKKTETVVAAETEAANKSPEPKVDEPIRSSENDILVDTSEIISETTPLAALENIVAIRTEPVVEAAELTEQPTMAIPVLEVTPTLAEAEEESESEAKRPKIEETIHEPPFIVQEVATVAVEAPVELLIPELVEKSEPVAVEVSEIETPVVQEQIPPTEPVAELAALEKIDESQPEISQIPLEIVPTTEDIAEAPATEMETVPTIAENTMSLDEDEPPAVEQEMTPIASKMDTDDTVEAAPMEFEDEAEPMDQ